MTNIITSVELRRPARWEPLLRDGPVTVTTYGKRTHMLLTIEQYKELTGLTDEQIDELMAQAEAV